MDGLETKTIKKPRPAYPLGQRVPEIGETIEVAPRVHWLRMPLPFALEWINLWLIDDGDSWSVVDTGMPTEAGKEAWRGLLETRLDGKPLKRLLVTHMHPDHVGNAGWLQRKTGAELWMSRLEYVTCRLLCADTGREAPKAALDFYRRAGWDDDALRRYKERFGRFGMGVSQMPDAFGRLSHDDRFQMGGQTWQVIVGSGHSPEHACLYCAELNVLISGDQILPRISSNVSVHPTEPDANPMRDWLESCARLKEAVPEDVLVLPAHNEPFTGAHARLQALIDGHEKGLVRLKKRLGESPRRVVDVFPALFARKIGPDLLGLATGEALAHLNCLIHRGEAMRETGEDGVDLYRLV